MIFARTFFYSVLYLPLLVMIMTVYARPRIRYPIVIPPDPVPSVPPDSTPIPSLACPDDQSPACCNVLSFGLAGKL